MRPGLLVVKAKCRARLCMRYVMRTDVCLHGRWPLVRNLVVVRDVKGGKLVGRVLATEDLWFDVWIVICPFKVFRR